MTSQVTLSASTHRGESGTVGEREERHGGAHAAASGTELVVDGGSGHAVSQGDDLGAVVERAGWRYGDALRAAGAVFIAHFLADLRK